MNKADFIVIGKVGSPYGVKGWLKVISYTELTMSMVDYTPWYLEEEKGWREVKITESRLHGKGIVVKLTGYNNPEDARALTGKKIAITRSLLPVLTKDEYYWSDLEGLTVINHRGETLGKVIFLMETGSNDVLVVKGEIEHAIPYLPDEVITKVDLLNRVIYVHWDLLR